MKYNTPFAELRLDPARNVFPDGSLTLGAPSKTTAISFPSVAGKEIPFSEKVNMVIPFLNGCISANMLKLRAGTLLVFFIPQRGGCIAAVNTSGGLFDPGCWNIMKFKNEFTDGSPLLKAFAEWNDAQNIGVFVETNDGSLQPVANIYETDLSAWQDKEFDI